MIKIQVLIVIFATVNLFGCSSRNATIEQQNFQMNPIILNSKLGHQGDYNWKMKRASEDDQGEVLSSSDDTGDWIPAIVPGTVLNSLVYNKIFPEPYWGTNNKISEAKIPDISVIGRDFYTYWFRTEFKSPKLEPNEKCWIQLDGINYIAELWINGKKLADVKGMFVQPIFDITDVIHKDDINVLAILIKPVEYPGNTESKMKDEIVLAENRNGGNGEMGKNVTMLMSAGWDFTFSDGIRDRNTGIWREVKLFTSGGLTLNSPFIKSELNSPGYNRAKINASVEVTNHNNEAVDARIQFSIKEINKSFNKIISLSPGETKSVSFDPADFENLVIKSPELWWPVNKGKSFLYHSEFTVSLQNEHKISDHKQIAFGIREITSDTNSPDGSRVFYVNGRRIFIRGSNWIPEGMLRNSEKRTKAELLMTQQSGINMLRLWGGGISESDQFFEMCDSLGIMVWHEFWMTGDTKAPVDHELYFENVRSTIKRIRNHPSLAYYVSSNEQDNVLGILPILEELDDTRGYQHQSECCGVHDGSPYKHENAMQYYDNTASDRGSRIDGFCPEYGTPCLPPVECLREMMPENKIWPIDTVTWNYLDGGSFHNMTTKYQDAINEFGPSKNIDEFVMKGQLVGAMAYRSIWENWNYNKFENGDRFASGLLFWYHNSPVRQVCSRMWDWSLEPTAALYFSQNALQPLHPQFDYLKNTVSVCNDYPEAFNNCQLKVKIYDLNSDVVFQDSVLVNLEAEAVANDILSIEFPNNISKVHFLKLSLKNEAGEVVGDSFYWRSLDKYQGPWTVSGPNYGGFESLKDLPKTKLKYEILKNENSGQQVISIENNSSKLAFFNRIKICDKDGNLIRPVLYSDNYFSLEPKEKKAIYITNLSEGLVPSKVVIKGWNVEEVTIAIN